MISDRERRKIARLIYGHPWINWAIKQLLCLKWKKEPEWLASSFEIDEFTTIHVTVETWRDGKHCYGTVVDE